MKILIVDDEQDTRETIVRLLEFEHIEARAAENGLAAKRMLEEDVFAAVVTDLNMPGMDGLSLLTWIQQEGPAIPVILMSAYGDIPKAVEAMKLGAQDYIVKPFNPDELLIRLKRILDNQKLQELTETGRQAIQDLQNWIGESPAMVAVKTLVRKIAPTPSTVLITGESGAGKEVVAKTIHQLSPRSAKAFMAINIGGVPENLLESELFGYERGAFTGANARKIGMFELASAGTLFLDEIGDMPIHLQIKLLRVLQERKIYRLGGVQGIPIDVRIISATNKSLEDLIAKGLFRGDLYYRLKVIQVAIPALRERCEDIPLLIGYFLKKYANKLGKNVQGMEPDAIRALQSYPFPGNVRELENMLERAMILAETDNITLQNIGLIAAASKPVTRKGTLENIEKQAILDALARWEGNRTRAAKELDIDRKTLLNKIKEYGIEGI
jgi:two-component system response regulator AtoC